MHQNRGQKFSFPPQNNLSCVAPHADFQGPEQPYDIATGKIPGMVLLILRDGKPVMVQAFGEQSPGTPMCVDSLHRIPKGGGGCPTQLLWSTCTPIVGGPRTPIDRCTSSSDLRS